MKYLIIGSAPYTPEYYKKKKIYYKDYFKCPINNAWKIVYPDISEWFIPDDFLYPREEKLIKGGTLIPNEIEMKGIQITPMPVCRINGYKHKKGSSMALNVMYILYNRYKNTNSDLRVVVMGSDFVYEKEKSHFYGEPKQNNVVHQLITYNNPKYRGIMADPLRFGDEWLKEELENVAELYRDRRFKIFVDTPLDETLLPFERI